MRLNNNRRNVRDTLWIDKPALKSIQFLKELKKNNENFEENWADKKGKQIAQSQYKIK